MNTQIHGEATEWLVKHRDGELSLKEKEAFDTWLRQSPQHVRAYLEMSAIWEDLPALGAAWNPTADELIARARHEDNVRPLVGTTRTPREPTAVRSPSDDHHQPGLPSGPDRSRWLALQASNPSRSSRMRGLALAAVLLLLVGAVAGWYGLYRNTYATEVGEQRSIVLADGSSIELNSRSRVRIRYTKARRDVDLLEGQALFRVAHEATRPFIVHSGMTKVLAVGTQFDVYKKASATVVTVVDGKVEVLAGGPSSSAEAAPSATPLPLGESKSPANSPVFLAAGEQLTIPGSPSSRAANATAAVSPQVANVAAATAWTQHNLVFDSSPLTEVAQEFNRYNRRPLVITDPEIASLRISGLFSSADPAVFLKFLRAQPELAVQETDREIRISKR